MWDTQSLVCGCSAGSRVQGRNVGKIRRRFGPKVEPFYGRFDGSSTFSRIRITAPTDFLEPCRLGQINLFNLPLQLTPSNVFERFCSLIPECSWNYFRSFSIVLLMFSVHILGFCFDSPVVELTYVQCWLDSGRKSKEWTLWWL